MRITNKQITAVVFSYRGEEEIIAMTLPRLHAAIPTARIHVFDDANDPLPKEVVTELKYTANCQYHQTTFDRKRNLNGKECILGELECMRQAMNEDGNTDGYMLKTDPDTVFLNADLIIDALEKGAKWVGHSSITSLFAGMCYVIHRTILEKVIENAKNMTLNKYAGEDAIIGSLIYAAASRETYSYTYIEVPNYPQAFAAFSMPSMDTPEYVPMLMLSANIGHVLTFGNATAEGQSRAWIVKAIHDLLNVFYNIEEYRDRMASQNQPFPGDNAKRLTELPIHRDTNQRDDINGDLVVRPGGNHILRGLLTAPITKDLYETMKKQRQAEEAYKNAVASAQQAATEEPKQAPVSEKPQESTTDLTEAN